MHFTHKALCLLFAAASLCSAAQPNTNAQTTGTAAYPNRGCGTPTLPAQFETWVQGLSQPQSSPGKLGGGQTQSVFNIPVIVHVVHNNEPLNSINATTGGNLNAAQIYDQINILNRDFNGLNADTSLIPSVFKPLLGKFQFNFCLAVVNPTGGVLAEPGIDRINRTAKSWTAPPYPRTYVTSTIKPNSIWDPSKYLNMWVLALGNNLLGYATFPNPGTSGLSGFNPPYGNATSDGLVMLNTAFGSIGTAASNPPYDLGRTAVHELGHWLGLRHIWGDGTCLSDYAADTPPAQGPNYGCPTHPVNVGVCTGNTTGEMFQNFMDYSDDACMYMFTKDQKNRAQLIMTHSPLRASLLTSTVCNTPTVTNEAGILYVSNPTYSQVISCSRTISPNVVVHNFGTNIISSATFSYNLNGANTQTAAWTGTLLPGTSATVALPVVGNLTNGSHQYNVGMYAINGGTDPKPINNVNNQQFSVIGQYSIAVSGQTAVCAGKSVTLTANSSATGYTWSPGTLTGSSVVLSPPATTVYTVSAYNGTCSSTRTVPVTVLPQPSVTVNSPSICAGSPAAIGASGACSYSWLPGALSGATITVSPSSTTQYTVFATGCNGCSATRVSTVTILPPLTLTLAVAPGGSLCPGGTATITASGASTYSWHTGATGSQLIVSPSVSTTYSVTGVAGTCSGKASALVPVGSNSLSLAVSPSQPTVCAGSTATLQVTGGTSYSWSTGSNSSGIVLSPVATTVVTVAGTNGPCSATKNVTITVAANPTMNVTAATASVCAGATTQVSASGAASYSWSNGSTGPVNTVSITTPSSYTVTGFLPNGCSDTETIAIGISGSTLTAAAAVTPSSVCSGGSATLSATGLSSYTWTGSGTGGPQVVQPPSGISTYTLQGFSGPCPATLVQSITVIAAPAFTAGASSTTLCNGATALLFAAGPYTQYTWIPGGIAQASLVVTPAVSTAYTVQASGSPGGCSSSSVINIAVSSAPFASLSTSNTPCNGPCAGYANVTVTGGTPPYSFSIPGSSCTALPCTNLCPALYTLHMTDAMGCKTISYFSIECFLQPGITETGTGEGRIYPNPVKDRLVVEITTESTFSLYNTCGQLLQTGSLGPGKNAVSLEGYSSGLYLLELRGANSTEFRKLIKE